MERQTKADMSYNTLKEPNSFPMLSTMVIQQEDSGL